MGKDNPRAPDKNREVYSPFEDRWFPNIMGVFMLLGASMCLMVLIYLAKWNFFLWQLMLGPLLLLVIFSSLSIYFLASSGQGKMPAPTSKASSPKNTSTSHRNSKKKPSRPSKAKTPAGKMIFDHKRILVETPRAEGPVEFPLHQLESFRVVENKLFVYTGTPESGKMMIIDLDLLDPDESEKLMELLSDSLQKKYFH